MFHYRKAALAAAAVMCAASTQAGAAVRYDFQTTGTGSSYQGSRTSSDYTVTSLQNIVISLFVGDNAMISTTPLGSYGAFNFPASGSFVADPSGFGFSTSLSQASGFIGYNISAKACFFNVSYNQPPTGTQSVDRSCSPVSLNFSDGLTIKVDQYSGTVFSVTATTVTGNVNGAYVTYANGVPEPSTWLLMLAGFGMVGYAMRRRRATLASVATATA